MASFIQSLLIDAARATF